MSSRAKFETEGEQFVHLTADFGNGVETRTFWAPLKGGYIREVTDDRPGTLGYQLCDGLAHTGSTLMWFPDRGYPPLIDIIRREWRAYQRAMAAAR